MGLEKNNLSSKKILIVEDDILTSNSYQKILGIKGYKSIFIAKNSKEAFSILNKENIDLILMDINLQSEIDGIELAKKINEIKNIPIVYITSNIEEDIINRIKQTVFYGYILKPIDFRELSVVVELAIVKFESEIKLKNSEKMYKDLLELAPDAFAQGDANGKFILVNNKMTEISGYSKEELLQMNMKDLFMPTTLINLPLRYDLLDIGQTITSEREAKKKDGSKIIIEMRSQKMPDGTYQSFIRDITERKKQEEKIIESEKKYKELQKLFRMIADNMPDMLWAKDIEKKYIFANKAICENLLISNDLEEPIGKTDMFFADRQRNLFPENLQWHTFGEICQDSDSIVLETKKTGKFEEYGNIKNKYLHLEVIKTPLLDENGELIGTAGAARDITERIEVEKALKESEEKYRTLVNNSLESIIIVNLEGNIIFVNNAFAKIMAVDNYEILIGKNVLEFLAPESIEEALKDFENVKNGIDSYVAVYRGKNINGELLWVESIGKRIKYNGIDANLISLRDITQRRIAELKLIENEEKYRSIIENTFDMISLLDLKGNYIFCNKTYSEKMGYDAEFIKNKSAFDIIHPEQKEDIRKFFNCTLQNSINEAEFNLKVVCKNGDIKLVSQRAKLLYDLENKADKILIVGQDITEKVELENKKDKLLKNQESLLKLATQKFADIHKLSNYVLNEILIFSQSEFAFYGFLTNDEKILNVYAWSKNTMKDCYVENKTVEFNVDNSGLWAEAIRQRKTLVVNDYNEKIKGKLGLPNGHIQIKRFLAIPIIINDKIVTLASVANKSSYYTDDEISMLENFLHNSQVIVDLEKSKLALVENEKKYRYMFLNNPQPMWIFDIDTLYFLEVNDAAINHYGYSREEFLNMTLKDIRPKEDVPLLLDDIERAKKIINPRSKWRHIKKNGDLIFVEIVSHPINFYNKDAWHVLVTDITEKKKTEEEIEKNNELLSSIINNIPVMITRFDSKLKMLLVNRNIEKLLGWTNEDLKTIDFMEKVYPKEEKRKIASDYMRKTSNEWAEFELTSKNGEIIISEWSNVKLKDGTTIGIGIDIGQRKNSEKALLESQRLSAIGEMSSAVAHDFNNALQSIVGNIELALLEKSLSDEIRNYLEIIKTATGDAATRVKLLQRFGGTKQTISKYEIVNINNVVNDVIIQTRPIWKDNVEKSGIKISVKSKTEEIPNIMGNEGELRSVLYNLVKNSVESMQKGGTILIHTFSKNGNVFVRVIDNGSGMDEEIKTKIFEPFFTTKGFEIGRGLGMSGAYGIIQEHNGKMQVIESEVGKGTTIEISLPVCCEKKEDVIIKEVIDTKIVANILWVDDDKSIIMIAKDMLLALGHQGDVASGGEEALALLEKNKYDLVVTDIGMPGMSGWELCEKINEKYHKKIKIAVLTGWGDQIDVETKEKYGIKYILGKPYKLNQVKQIITDAITKDLEK